MNSVDYLQVQWARVRRRWVLVFLVGLVAAAAVLGASLWGGTTYTGLAVLTVGSPKRAPEKDAVLVQGYADFFNQPSAQASLRATAGVDSSVALMARVAGASPIMYIDATATSPDLAAQAATKMAVALRDSVSKSLASNTNDQLLALQLHAGVIKNPSSAARHTGIAGVVGLVVGLLVAMALGRFENRIVHSREVRARLGLEVLATVELARRSKDDARGQALGSLVGLTNPPGVPRPGTLAVTGVRADRGTKTHVAICLAVLRAMQGQTALLLQADLGSTLLTSALQGRPGVTDFLADHGSGRIEGRVYGDGRGLLVVPPGSQRDDSFALFSSSHVEQLFGQCMALADLVVIDTPPAGSMEAQAVCVAASRSLLVIEEGRTRAADAMNARDALAQAGATPPGVVLVRNADQLGDIGLLGDRNWAPAAVPEPRRYGAGAS